MIEDARFIYADNGDGCGRVIWPAAQHPNTPRATKKDDEGKECDSNANTIHGNIVNDPFLTRE